MEKRDKYVREAVELLRSMVAVPSVSFDEASVCSLISETLEARGIPHHVVGNNIVATGRDFDADRKTMMLCAHIDTVPPNSGYSFDPYNPDPAAAEKATGLAAEEAVFGLGSNDDGGSVVAMCAAFGHFQDKKLPFNLVLVLSCEEERSGPGGMSMIWEHYSEIEGTGSGKRPDWAIIGEPTGMKAATSERGLLVIDGEASGVSGHAARGEGVNALYLALEDIDRLRRHEFTKISPTMGAVRLNVTQIEAGTAHNVIPDRCRFVVDIRPTEMYGNLEILQELQKICRSTLKARNLNNRSSATMHGSPLLECARQLGIETFSSPTTSDWIRIGCDAVKMGPGESGRSHRKDEFITVREIRDGIDGYIRFIEKFSGIYGNTMEQRDKGL